MGYLKLKDAGAHSVGLNNTNRIVSARPEFVVTNPLEFTVSGGTAASPQLQHAQSGLISAATELWLKFAGSAGLVPVSVGAVTTGAATGMIPRTDGTPIGNATDGGGLAKAFDGVTSGEAYGAVAAKSSTPTGPLLIGKDWGAGVTKVVSGFKTYGSSNYGYTNSGVTITVTLQGSNDGSSWTDLGTASGTDAASLLLQNMSIASTTPYRYHQVSFSGWNYSVNNAMCAEVEFYGPVATTYTLSGLSPAQSALPEKVFKVRNDKTKALMALACGATDEPLVKETALTLAGSGTTASQVVVSGVSSLLPYFATGNLSKDIIITVGGVDSVVQPSGTVTESGNVPTNTLDPSNCDATITLTNGNRTFVGTSAYRGARLLGALTGKKVWFVRMDSGGYSAGGHLYTGGGVVKSTWTTNFGGDYSVDQNSAFWVAETICKFSGTSSAAGVSGIVDGDVLMFAVDVTNGRMWVGKNGAWVGDPAAGTGYVDSWTPSGSYYAMVGGYQAHGTILSDSYTPPSGFTALSISDHFTTTIPIPAQASAPTAAKLRSRFQTLADIASVTWTAGSELTVAGAEIEITNEAARRMALKLRSDVTAVQLRARAAKIYTKEMPA